ncbi:MAG: hypothetical protein ACWGQW_02495 [bacterium]
MTFIHSGDAGDVIMALPAMRELASRRGVEKFNLILGTKQGVLHPFTPEWAENLAALIRIQPYINDVWRQREGDRWDADLDPYRAYLMNNFKRWKNITRYCCELLQVQDTSHHPWLTVDEMFHVEHRPVVINRTPRYRNPLFNWGRIYNRYKNVAFFIGHEDEYDRFQEEVGPIPYVQTQTILDAARLIAGSKLFIGNQSLCKAIAEGLKQNTILESNLKLGNCIWHRHNMWVGMDGKVPMPDPYKL